MLNRLILLIYHARCCLQTTGIRFITDSLHPDVAVHAVNFLQIRYDFFPSQCRKWVWPSTSLSTLEWKSTASITAMSYSLSRCCQWWSMLQAIRLSFNKTTLHLIVQRTCTIKLLQQETLDFIGLISGHQTAQTWIPWTIKSGVLCSREYMNDVWPVSMSWSSALLISGTVCSGTLLTRTSTTGENNWERACVQMDNILNIYCKRVWLTTVMDKWNISNFVYSQKRCLFTAEIVIFRILKFPKVKYAQ